MPLRAHSSLLLISPGAHDSGLLDPDDHLLGSDHVLARDCMAVLDLSDGLVLFVGVVGLELVRVDRHLPVLRVGRSTHTFKKESEGLLPRVKVAGCRAGPT